MAAIFFTPLGKGPFVVVTELSARTLIGQLHVGVIALVGLVLALGRDERVALMRALEREKGELAAHREQRVSEPSCCPRSSTRWATASR